MKKVLLKGHLEARNVGELGRGIRASKVGIQVEENECYG
jgi:hypothetical protein